MKYPRISREQRIKNGSAKLTDAKIEIIRSLRRAGMTYVGIASLMNINRTMVMYWCLPQFRIKIIKKNSASTSRRWRALPKEKKVLQNKRAWLREKKRCKVDKDFRYWYRTHHKDLMRRWSENHSLQR